MTNGVAGFLSSALAVPPGHASRFFLFTPDIGILLLTLSSLLIFWELHRPGMILPGASGLLGVLLVLASWRQWLLRPVALLLLLAGAVLPILQLRRHLPPSWLLWLVASTLSVVLGCGFLIAGPVPAKVHWPVALLCGVSLGTGGSLLLRIGGRARRNKRVN